ncbi:MAG: hypothetical protein A3G25_10325 [Betaproteobacteria bacterium RIFCSPLOWO2_12_FULL_63_13]|nr:MAG: hypothetical protein A3H32_19680 [Betaproteobacteria bacterium RIFCSPLOWO2_02_FULL_63_19]OGA45056.1 MAG: hypothetical protein A3G25_10325 [Betaproteobacteria bacterium RIFCSPLOWO2_12_FULL_63_13]
MNELGEPNSKRTPDEGLVAWTHVIYGLHAVAVLIGVTSAVTVVGAFVFSLPSIVAVVLSYLKRGEAAGTFLESHYRWLIRTFWFAVLWGGLAVIVSVALVLTIVGILIAWLPVVVVGVWLVYRVARGWLALKDANPVGPLQA